MSSNPHFTKFEKIEHQKKDEIYEDSFLDLFQNPTSSSTTSLKLRLRFASAISFPRTSDKSSYTLSRKVIFGIFNMSDIPYIYVFPLGKMCTIQKIFKCELSKCSPHILCLVDIKCANSGMVRIMKYDQIQKFLDAFQLIEGELCQQCQTILKEFFMNPLIYAKTKKLKHIFDDLHLELCSPRDRKEQQLIGLRENKAYFEEELKRINKEIEQLS